MNTKVNSFPQQAVGNVVSPKVSFRGFSKGVEISSPTVSSVLQKINKHVSSPEQRLILGVTALFTQPFIDLSNKRVNEETRLMSFARTLAKIVVGTTVGVLVRKECIRLAHHYSKMDAIPKLNAIESFGTKANKYSFLSPQYVRTYNKDFHNNYANALGSYLGIGVSLVTNFLIDAPLTQLLTNHTFNVLKKDPKEQTATSTPSVNLLERTLADNSRTKQVSFTGINPNRFIENGKHEASGWFNSVKLWFWQKVCKKPGDMLMHTGAIGWGASSLAQVVGMSFNDKIDSNKKRFLIPQEIVDAIANIALYYGVTSVISGSVEAAFENGLIRIKSVMDKIRDDMKSNGIRSEFIEDTKKLTGKEFKIEDIFGSKLGPVEDFLKNRKTRQAYLQHKNGAAILATLISSVISCNILAPYCRNFFASYFMDKSKEHTQKLNAQVFDMMRDANYSEINPFNKKPAFDKFIV